MKAYKGFNRNEDGTLSCQGFVYEPGKTYKHEGKIELCWRGFHACHELHQVWYYYPNNGHNAFYEVECGGEIIESPYDYGKIVCSEIKLVKEVDMSHIQTFSFAWPFYDDFAVIILDEKFNFINTEGGLLSEQWFDVAWSFYEGFAMVQLNGKWNFIDTEGKLLSEQWFDDAWDFHEGLARVKIDGKWLKINTKGEIVEE